jgi:hypothetical protein
MAAREFNTCRRNSGTVDQLAMTELTTYRCMPFTIYLSGRANCGLVRVGRVEFSAVFR